MRNTKSLIDSRKLVDNATTNTEAEDAMDVDTPENDEDDMDVDTVPFL